MLQTQHNRHRLISRSLSNATPAHAGQTENPLGIELVTDIPGPFRPPGYPLYR